MNIMQEYKDAARLLFDYTLLMPHLGGRCEIGAMVKDGVRKAAIEVMPRGKLDDDTTQYLVNINWPLLDKLARKEENEQR